MSEWKPQGPSPLEEMKFIFTNFGPALKKINWPEIGIATMATYAAAFLVFLVTSRLLHGQWELARTWPRAALVTALVSLNLIFQKAYLHIAQMAKDGLGGERN